MSTRASIKSSKYRKCSWISCWYIQLPVLLPIKKVCHDLKMAAILKYQTHRQKLWQKGIFHGYDVIGDVTGWPECWLLYSCLEASCKGNVSSIHANIVIVFRGYTYWKISTYNTFSTSQVKGQRHRITRWPWHLMAVTPSILGSSRWNKKWNVRNSHSYVAIKIRFHFQFPRPLDAEFVSRWLLNLKFRFGCRIISIIANHAKCNYFLDDDGIDNVTLRLWKFSDFCSRHTVGVAGDDIMYNILVYDMWWKYHVMIQRWLRCHIGIYAKHFKNISVAQGMFAVNERNGCMIQWWFLLNNSMSHGTSELTEERFPIKYSAYPQT